MIKKILSTIVLAILLAIIVIAAGSPTVRVSDSSARRGDTVKVTVSLENNPGIINMKLKLSYDRNALTLIKVEDTGILGEALHPPIAQATYPYTLTWANDLAEENFTINGTLVTLTFKVNAAYGRYPITITYGNGYIYNFDLKPVAFSVVNGAVTVARSKHMSLLSWQTR